MRCGRRRVDPVRGASTWRRAVLRGEQVLVCPDCQEPGWTDGLDTCETCGSTMLAKQLGAVVCRACGATSQPLPRGDAPAGTAPDPALTDDVAAALDRLLGRE